MQEEQQKNQKSVKKILKKSEKQQHNQQQQQHKQQQHKSGIKSEVEMQAGQKRKFKEEFKTPPPPGFKGEPPPGYKGEPPTKKAKATKPEGPLPHVTFIPSMRGGRVAYSAGFKYTVNSTRATTTYWKCREYKCSGTLVTRNDVAARACPRKHNHPPSPFLYGQDFFKYQLMERARREAVPVPRIYKEELARLTQVSSLLPAKMLHVIPCFESVKTSMYRERHKAQVEGKRCDLRPLAGHQGESEAGGHDLGEVQLNSKHCAQDWNSNVESLANTYIDNTHIDNTLIDNKNIDNKNIDNKHIYQNDYEICDIKQSADDPTIGAETTQYAHGVSHCESLYHVDTGSRCDTGSHGDVMQKEENPAATSCLHSSGSCHPFCENIKSEHLSETSEQHNCEVDDFVERDVLGTPPLTGGEGRHACHLTAVCDDRDVKPVIKGDARHIQQDIGTHPFSCGTTSGCETPSACRTTSACDIQSACATTSACDIQSACGMFSL